MKDLGLAGWAKIAEIVSGFAVVISLLVVAYTVSQNTVALRSSSDDAVYAALREIQSVRFTSPELAQAVVLLRRNEGLSDIQQVMWNEYQNLILSIWENTYFDQDREIISQPDWQDWNAYFVAYFSDQHEGLNKELWASVRGWYSDAFVHHVDQSLFNGQ
jgi:hypothetical protein